MCVKLKHAKFQLSSEKETCLNWGLTKERWGRKFNGKLSPFPRYGQD